jgi:hypothetical protein
MVLGGDWRRLAALGGAETVWWRLMGDGPRGTFRAGSKESLFPEHDARPGNTKRVRETRHPTE